MPPPFLPKTTPAMKSRSTRFPNYNPATAAGLMTWILIIALHLALLRSFVASGWSPADIVFASLIFIAFCYVFVAILTPISLKRAGGIAADRQYLPLDPDSNEAPEAFRTWSQSVIPSMEALGFLVRGHFRPSSDVPNSKVFVTLFENRKSGQTAQLFTVIAQRGIIQRGETVLTLTTRFSDRTKLYTSNYRALVNHPQIRIRHGSMSFPDIDDPRRLYAIHQATLLFLGASAERINDVIDDPADYLRTEFHEDVAKLAESGYYYLDTQRDLYRRTWRGAILVTWRMLWPFKWFRELRRRSQRARLLRELDLSG
jgi:hypothetical protein